MFGNDFCDVEMKSRYYLAFFSWRHPHYMRLHQRLPNQTTENIRKRSRIFPTRGQSWNNSRKPKVKKIQVQTRVEKYFSFWFPTLNGGGWNVKKKRWGKQSYLATSKEDIREAHTILAYCFTDLPYSLQVYTLIHQWCLNAK